MLCVLPAASVLVGIVLICKVILSKAQKRELSDADDVCNMYINGTNNSMYNVSNR
jgi:hypothetical protein